MAIINASLDSTEQNSVIGGGSAALATGVTLLLGMVPYSSTVQLAKVAAEGISGTPTGLLSIGRFIVGSGNTSITVGFTSLTLQAVGTSGLQTIVQAAAGSSWLQLQAGDRLYWTSGGSNAAITGLLVRVVIKAVQDIRSTLGAT